jgi:hypothetical protein
MLASRVRRLRFRPGWRSLLPALVIGSWIALARPARALPEGSVAVVTTGMFSAAVGTGGLVTIIGNGVNLARRAPNRSWPISGYILGSLNVIVGAVWFAIIRIEDPLWAVGGSMIGIGVTDIGLSIAGHVKHARTSVSPSPVPLAGLGGQLTGGAGVRLSF